MGITWALPSPSMETISCSQGHAFCPRSHLPSGLSVGRACGQLPACSLGAALLAAQPALAR